MARRAGSGYVLLPACKGVGGRIAPPAPLGVGGSASAPIPDPHRGAGFSLN